MNAPVLYIDSNRENAELAVTIKPSELLYKKDIIKVQNKLRQKLHLKVFTLEVKYLPNMFRVEYFLEIV